MVYRFDIKVGSYPAIGDMWDSLRTCSDLRLTTFQIKTEGSTNSVIQKSNLIWIFIVLNLHQ